jgi:hypothetical protein
MKMENIDRLKLKEQMWLSGEFRGDQIDEILRRMDLGHTFDSAVQSKPGMTWKNYGKGRDEWSIDHSRPISSFSMTTTLSEINALENIRPMWHRQNCSKKNKWEGQ